MREMVGQCLQLVRTDLALVQQHCVVRRFGGTKQSAMAQKVLADNYQILEGKSRYSTHKVGIVGAGNISIDNGASSDVAGSIRFVLFLGEHFDMVSLSADDKRNFRLERCLDLGASLCQIILQSLPREGFLEAHS